MSPLFWGEKMSEKVYFFATCLIDLFYPRVGLAGMELLRQKGLKVVFPQDQTCCGQPAYNSGFKEEAKKVAQAQIKAFPENWPIIVPSGSCAAMLRHHYPKLFADSPLLPQVEAFANRVYELTWYLVNVLDFKPEDKGEPLKITWHGSCHSLREMGVKDEPKSLLKGLAQVELLENPREKECCGFGGTFAVREPEISAAMVGDKIQSIEETGASRVISGDCGCLMNIGGALAKAGKNIKAQHIAEFLLERGRK